MNQRITTVDLFAGAGGMSLGFKHAGLGFEPVSAVEHAGAAARTFKRHFGCCVDDRGIEDVDHFPNADVIIGGLPPHRFDRLGRTSDGLGSTWAVEHYLRMVRQVGPAAFVIECGGPFQNSSAFARLIQVMERESNLRGYRYDSGVLDSADYGAPQHRRRWFFIAVRQTGSLPWPPPPTHGPPGSGLLTYRTVRDAIEDLPAMTSGYDVSVDDVMGTQHLHFGRCPTVKSLARYAAIPEGGNRFDLARDRPDLLPRCWAEKPTGTTDVMGRLWWDRPSVTIRTEFFKPEKGRYLHPVADRAISHREAARLQSFPDDFVFEGSKTEIAQQIGNAVPIPLAEAVARHVHALLTAQKQLPG